MPLSHAFVTAPSSTPDRWFVFLHGILGSGANWRTFAKQIVGARPSWGVVLVDLRLHGESQTGFSPPHTVAATANDVAELVASIGHRGPVRAVLGHSFGGKVAIEYARGHGASLDHLYVIDSTPSARPDYRGSSGTMHIVDLLRNLPEEFGDRNAFTTWMEERGVARPIAMWLAMNVRPVPNTTRFEFRIDVPGIRAMLEDYFIRDSWDVLENPPGLMRTHLIVGGASDIVDQSDIAHAARCPRTTIDVLPNVGHWVHAEAPDALRDLVLGYLDG
ncbi:hydrolase, alpha/beta fold family, putative [Labilithrix luteola]|uniref:Hydrolase, alpha/beta fold family, putative n=1 Tax=Labilithrix luteola TaxID=1391654 RepID=A0A0K1QAR0_9BACT|nr:alpha/beta hydrolase [Labilithrix luteola]AKV02876.1 hydrolase, alpha/beta fold family, putative [Labilithrix luteola]